MQGFTLTAVLELIYVDGFCYSTVYHQATYYIFHCINNSHTHSTAQHTSAQHTHTQAHTQIPYNTVLFLEENVYCKYLYKSFVHITCAYIYTHNLKSQRQRESERERRTIRQREKERVKEMEKGERLIIGEDHPSKSLLLLLGTARVIQKRGELISWCQRSLTTSSCSSFPLFSLSLFLYSLSSITYSLPYNNKNISTHFFSLSLTVSLSLKLMCFL